MLFVLCALVPLSLCAAFLVRQFGSELMRIEQRNLDGLVRSFGTTLLGRLGSADDALESIVSGPPGTDEQLTDRVAHLPWVRSAQTLAPQPLRRAGVKDVVPPLTPYQIHALETGNPVLLWTLDRAGAPRVYLVHRLVSGAWLYAELAGSWLWASSSEFAGGAGLLVLDDRSRPLASGGEVPAAALRARRMSAAAIPDRWLSRSWEIFLRGRYASPSWQVLALGPPPALVYGGDDPYLYLLGLVLATILLVAGLSMMTIRRQLQPLAELTEAANRVAVKDFGAFEHMTWKDEFGDLARSFSAMSRRLSTQFSTLETLAEVDRQLLQTSDLESILDTLLPRIASVLHCECVSVLLLDRDSDDHVRAYDYWVQAAGRLPVRRIPVDVAALEQACQRSAAEGFELAAESPFAALVPATPRPVRTLGLHALRPEGRVDGVLCVGYAGCLPGAEDSGVGAADFADRLSLILVNLQHSESLRRQANYDSLTGLQNRLLFSQRVSAAVAAAQKRRGLGGLLYLDLDHFKRVNDTTGHAAGDGLLRLVGERLGECAEDGHSIARLGGDEFAVLLPVISSPDKLRPVAERIIAVLQRPFIVNGREHHISASIGISVFPTDGARFEDLLKSSDIAMYRAKDAGRGRAVFFETDMQRQLMERLTVESGFYRALRQRAFRVLYQPIISQPAGEMAGVEALVRWPRGDGLPWTPPALFIPIAEENGSIVELGEWILREACAQFARWREEGVKLRYVSVNVSVRQLREREFLTRLLAVLNECGMRAEDLYLEITEGVLASGAELEHTLAGIAGQGIGLSLDDFGTGYSSLSYLRIYPIKTVKIDRSFVQSLPEDPTACHLAESIIRMCAALRKSVVAEGVETRAQQEFLRRIGCENLQGYFFGRPMEAADIAGFARRLHSSQAPGAREAYDWGERVAPGWGRSS